MNVMLFGGSGMVGQGVLLECLRDPGVAEVRSIVRAPSGRHDPKLREIVHHDFFDFSSLGDALSGVDACFYCLGATSAGKSEAEYTRITYDITIAAARALLAMPFHASYVFRPGIIQPLDGIQSRTAAYRIGYKLFAPLTPVLARRFP